MKNELETVLSSKQCVINTYVDMLHGMKSEYDLFAFTVVFNDGSECNKEDQSIREYNRVMKKLEKKISRHACDMTFSLPDFRNMGLRRRNEIVDAVQEKLKCKRNQNIVYADICYYEYDITSFLSKRMGISRDVHHVHGVVAVPKRLTKRIWDSEQGMLCDRLRTDIRKMSTVSSYLFEPLIPGKEGAWLTYIAKGKSFNK